ncbi:MAG TPA: PIN domain-containing protein [Solirubrobacterales bacterium]|nr:PIN domain-containing protein [Solirubrobacterales bacterium]
MTFLDACALIALIHGEPAMKRVSAILREGSAAMTSTNVAEVFDVVARKGRIGYTRVADVVEPLFEGPLALVPVDLGLARRAAEVRTEHYHRKRCSLSLADATLLAAPAPGDKIASSDADVLAVAAELGIETIKLPPSSS